MLVSLKSGSKSLKAVSLSLQLDQNMDQECKSYQHKSFKCFWLTNYWEKSGIKTKNVELQDLLVIRTPAAVDYQLYFEDAVGQKVTDNKRDR